MYAIVTGGAGFIGSHLTNQLLKLGIYKKVIVLDSLTYASNIHALDLSNQYLEFHEIDITNAAKVEEVFSSFCETQHVIFHLAAESHVDRSINSGMPFVTTNVLGTQVILENALKFKTLKVLHVSTDEVYGSIAQGEADENSPLNPSSIYSASKSASDLLVKAMSTTHELKTLISRCVNNYGIAQSPEKFIPRMIMSALLQQDLPIYGDGNQSREWISVEDHVDALILIMQKGAVGNIYNIGTEDRMTNLELANEILKLTDSSSKLKFVRDRKGHDIRYALDSTLLRQTLQWTPKKSLRVDLPHLIDKYRQLSTTNEYMKTFSNSERFYESI